MLLNRRFCGLGAIVVVKYHVRGLNNDPTTTRTWAKCSNSGRVAHIPDLENVQTWVSSHPVSDDLPRRKSQIDPRNEEISRF